MDKKLFIEKITGRLPKDRKSATPQQVHNALGKTIMEMYSGRWNISRKGMVVIAVVVFLTMHDTISAIMSAV